VGAGFNESSFVDVTFESLILKLPDIVQIKHQNIENKSETQTGACS
jgi:hypothetical protein